MTAEQQPDNVVYIDEYPELKKRVWLRRLNAMRELGVFVIAHEPADVIEFPHEPDEPA